MKMSVTKSLKPQTSNIKFYLIPSLIFFCWWIIFFPLVNIGQSAFESLTQIVHRLHVLLENSQDEHGRNQLLASYITYVFSAPYNHSPPSSPDHYTGWLLYFIYYLVISDGIDGIIVSALDSESRGSGSGPGRVIVLYSWKTLYSQCLSPPRSING